MRSVRRQLAIMALALLACAVAPQLPAQDASANPAVGTVTAINDRDYYPAVLKLIENARHSVQFCLYEAEYYLEYPGSSSNNLLDALMAAAKRGVAVTVVIDRSGFRNGGAHDEKNQAAAKLLAEAGVVVYLDPDEVQSHQKFAIFDRDIVVINSTNWKHYSLNSNREVGLILWSKKAALEYGQYYAQRVADGHLFMPEAVPNTLANALTPQALGFKDTPVQAMEFLNNRWYFYNCAQAIRRAKKSVTLIQNYANWYPDSFGRLSQVPNRPAGKPSETNLLMDELIAAHQRGIEVTVVMDFTYSAEIQREWRDWTRDFAKKLSEAGVRVLRDDPNEQIHAKMLILDDEEVIVGSTNWSFEALEMNNETSVLVRSADLVRDVYAPWRASIMEKAQPWDAPLPDIPKIEEKGPDGTAATPAANGD